MFTIKKNKLYHILFTFSMAFVVMLTYIEFNKQQSLSTGINKLTLLCCFVYVGILVSSYKINGKIGIYFILILMTIPFYLGDQLSYLLGYEEYMLKSDHSILDGIISNTDIYIAMFVLMASLIGLHLGYICIYSKSKNTYKDIDKLYYINKNKANAISMRYVAWILYILTIIPALIVRLNDIYMSKMLGHLAYRLESASNVPTILYILDYLGDWFVPSCLIMAIFCKSKQERKIAISSILSYCVLYLFGGNRMDIIGIIVALTCICVYWYGIKVSKRKIVKYIILAFAVVFVFQMVGTARETSGGLDMFSWDVIKVVLKKNFIYSIFEITGNTFTSIANTVKCVPQFVPFNNGKSIIGSLLYILPSALRGQYLDSIVTHISSVLSPYYYGWTISGYGSSFITEAYFNYYYWCIPVVMIYGGVFAKIIKTIENADFAKPFSFYISVYMIWEITNGIRNDLYFIPRHLILYVFLPYVAAMLISKLLKK